MKSLLKLINSTNEIPVKVEPHQKFDFKGIIYCEANWVPKRRDQVGQASENCQLSIVGVPILSFPDNVHYVMLVKKRY